MSPRENEGESSTSLLGNESTLSYQACEDNRIPKPNDRWHVHMDGKGQIDTLGDETNESFSWKKLLQYTGPGRL